MAINFPTSLDSLTNPTGTSQVSVVDHASQHSNTNDALEALEAKVGINSSAETTSLDYKLSAVTGTAKAVSTAGNQTVYGIKTFYNDGAIVGTAFSIANPKLLYAIKDTNENEIIELPTVASAVNHIKVIPAVAGTASAMQAVGDDTDVSLALLGKGSGGVLLGTARVKFPNSTGSNGQVLQSDGAGNARWASLASTTPVKALIPRPVALLQYSGGGANTPISGIQMNVNTTAHVGLFDITHDINVNKISISAQTVGTGGTAKVGFYDDSGTQKFTVDIPVTGTGLIPYTISPEQALSAGCYYVVVVPNGTTDITLRIWLTIEDAYDYHPSGEPILTGTVSVTASTLPASLTPTAIGKEKQHAILFRLDN